jgi:sugar phosphate isomerase/epimerase
VFQGENDMKLCFSTLGCSDRDLEQIIALADNYGIKNLEFRGVGGVIDNAKIEAFLPKNEADSKRKLADSGISPAVLGASSYFHDEANYDAAIADGIASIDIAQRFGIKYIRVFGDRIADENSVARVISGLKTLTEYAKDAGVTVLLETHGEFNNVEALKPIIDAMSNTDAFGLIWDIQHTHRFYGKNCEEFYAFAKPYVRHVHVKDFSDANKALCNIGNGDIPIREIVDRLVADGYDGCFSLEWEKRWHPELSDIEQALEDFVRIMK